MLKTIAGFAFSGVLISDFVSAILVYDSVSVFVLLFYRAPDSSIFQQILPAGAFDRNAD